MSIVDCIKILVETAVIILGCYALYHEADLIRFENKVKKKIRKYARALIWAIEAVIAERKVNMFVIKKAPGRAPERLHHVANNFGAIARELDSENPYAIEIGKGIEMWYDSDAFAKQAADCMTDKYGEKIYYGEVIFCATTSEGMPRSLTEREVKFVESYIAENRTDKQYA